MSGRELSGEDLEKYNEAQQLLRSIPHPVSIFDGTADYSNAPYTIEQKLMLLPFLARVASGYIKELQGDDKVSAEVTERLFGFLNEHMTWHERVCFTRIFSLLLKQSFTRFTSTPAWQKFAAENRAYLRGAV